jgi:oxalate decarboxylase
VLEALRASRYVEVSLDEWFGNVVPELLMQYLNLTREDLKKLPRDRSVIVPVR